MKKTNQIITIHLGVLLLYTLIFAVFEYYSDTGVYNADNPYGKPYRWVEFMFLQAFTMIGHVITIAILASNQPKNKPEYAKAHWLSLGFVLLLGGSICFITPGLFQKNFY